MWNILHEHGIDPAPERNHTTWANFLHSQAQAILAADFFETKTLTGATLHILHDARAKVKFLIRDRDSRYPAAFDTVLQTEGIEVVQTGVRMPRMNAVMERWVRTCRTELVDRTLVWNQAHLLHALCEYEQFYNQHRPHHTLEGSAPLRPRREPITDPGQLTHLNVHRHDRLGGILHEYQHAA